MASVPRSKNLETRLKELEQRLYTIERASGLSSSSIGEGGMRLRAGGSIRVTEGGMIVVESEDGTVDVFSVGDLTLNNSPAGIGMLIKQADSGQPIALISDDPSAGPRATLYDGGGSAVVSVEAGGLDVPYHQYPMYRQDTTAFYVNSTASYVNAWIGWLTGEHPVLEVVADVQCAAGNTGEARFLIGAVVVAGPTQFTADGQISWTITNVRDHIANATSSKSMGLQVKRVSPAGASVGIRPYRIMGRGTAA